MDSELALQLRGLLNPALGPQLLLLRNAVLMCKERAGLLEFMYRLGVGHLQLLELALHRNQQLGTFRFPNQKKTTKFGWSGLDKSFRRQ